jgi:DNA-binding NarL/FixJ family response regulator
MKMEGPAVIRVLLVDDHAMVRQGLRSILGTYPDFEIVGEASNGEEALRCVRELAPSVVVMDINMPKLNGIEATARIKRTYPHVVIVGLSVNASDENRHAMTAAGASMLLTKEAAVEQLYAEIKESVNRRSSALH